MIDSDEGTAALHFATDITPLFRDFDRNSMVTAFDLWDYSDVVAHQDAILSAVESGAMPCDGAWPSARVAVLKRWIAEGSKP
ncbi:MULTISPECIES: hypothetical protein [unclassified Rathayibacter]|uniref:hypothetical protein n=1 Tax=unclassified Rathayibacter TaxID=2609250 RepID=UPI0006FD56F5|nr:MULTISPECIES: hypothetical protein [unclassified Rathayibacter]KQQ03574.1 hypothetical protein ASF42_08735 [Rathayibacter sp. Leaf294]KQS12030.1 hypothetical protein ASG06_08735 [Rathayibacter sp. Leaf185]